MNDEELRARLQASDPAASLPPAAPHEAARLLEDVMATELSTRNESEGSRETGTRGRGPLTWLVAAAAVVVIAGVGLLGFHALAGDGDDDRGTAAQSVTELDVPAAAGTGKCMVPNADAMAGADVAFDGTVTSIAGDQVTLEPSHWYAGGPTDRVVVTAPSEQMQQVASAVTFQAGGRYLVSATEGHVSLCGFSAAYTEGLAAVYAEAFPG